MVHGCREAISKFPRRARCTTLLAKTRTHTGLRQHLRGLAERKPFCLTSIQLLTAATATFPSSAVWFGFGHFGGALGRRDQKLSRERTGARTGLMRCLGPAPCCSRTSCELPLLASKWPRLLVVAVGRSWREKIISARSLGALPGLNGKTQPVAQPAPPQRLGEPIKPWGVGSCGRAALGSRPLTR